MMMVIKLIGPWNLPATTTTTTTTTTAKQTKEETRNESIADEK